MRKRKSVKNSDGESNGADEPEEFQDSGEDWTPGAESNATPGAKPAANNRKRASGGPKAAASKKKRANSSEEDTDPEEEKDGEEEEEEEGGSDDSDEGNKSDSSQPKDVPNYFHSGNFVLLKSDVKWEGDKVVTKLSDLNLWKIDGKALLQKYIPMDYNSRVLHKCTCVYSGWNVENRENYYPITEIVNKNPKTDAREPCVELNIDNLILVKDKK